MIQRFERLPALIAPSPMTATTRRSPPVRAAAIAMPSAALIEVLEWPTPNVSYSLSARLGNGASPSLSLIVLQPLAPAGQHLVRIGLVADVPDQPVVRRVEDIVQRDGEFDRAEAGGEMTAHLADRVDQVLAQLARELCAVAPAAARADRPASRSRQQRVGVGGVIARKFTRKDCSVPSEQQPAAERRQGRCAAQPRSAEQLVGGCVQLVHARAARPRRRRRRGRSACRVRVGARWPCRARSRRLRRRGCRPGSERRGRRRAELVERVALPGREVRCAGRGHQHAGADQRAGLERVHVLDLGER